MQPPQPLRTSGRRARHVDVLAPDHPSHARGVGQLARRRQHVGRLAPLLGEQQREGLGVEAIAGQDRDVLAERTVTRGLPSADVVIVHRGQVVVDQRVGMDQLERGCEGQHVGGVESHRGRRGQSEHGADPLARREQRVAHRLLQPVGGRIPGEAQPDEIALHLGLEMLRELDRFFGGDHYCAAGNGSWPGRSGRGSTAARARSSIAALTLAMRAASRAHSSIASSAVCGSSSPDRSRSAVSLRLVASSVISSASSDI